MSVVVSMLGFILSACLLRPEWQKLVAGGEFDSVWVDAGNFSHLRLWNRVPGDHLRLYVEGDGNPWVRESKVAVDPTPVDPVLLRLMHRDEEAAVYLGRPCYFGTATSNQCHQRWWTFERYSPAVTDSMCKAANEVIRSVDAKTVQLIGFSGGAAIALAMAHCTERLVAVTTVAGNLDPDAWTEHHGYLPLVSDNNGWPVNSTTVAETHWQCGNDKNIPPSITEKFFAMRPAAIRHIVDECTHATGWEKYWQQIVAHDSAEKQPVEKLCISTGDVEIAINGFSPDYQWLYAPKLHNDKLKAPLLGF